MRLRRALATLFGSPAAERRRGSVERQSPERRASDDYRLEFEVEKELKRGMRGDA